MSSASPRNARLAEWLYALAYLGAHVGFMPMLVLLLPRRLAAWGLSGAAETLSWLLLAGAITASLTHIVAGHWSDKWLVRHGSRRGLITLGTVLLAATYVGIGFAGNVYQLAALVISFQITLNVMFAPLGALLADYIADGRKGAVSGMLNAAMPLSYGIIAALSWGFPADSDAAFLMVAGLVAILILPLALFWPFKGPAIRARPQDGPAQPYGASMRDFACAWSARLLIQLGGVLITGYLFLYISDLQNRLGAAPYGGPSGYLGQLSLLALAGSFSMAVISGRLSDVLALRRLPMAAFATMTALGLVVMANAPAWMTVAMGYAIFTIGLAGFLAIDSALVAQLLSGHPKRGALLGVMNLTNTLPSVFIPAFALLAIADRSVSEMLPVLLYGAAAAAALASVLAMQIRLVK